MTTKRCTCAGTAPGYPQHESYCGQPERDDVTTTCPGCGREIEDGWAVDHCDGERHYTAEDIAEERLKGRDYEAWANL